jgi:hypothetical protein
LFDEFRKGREVDGQYGDASCEHINHFHGLVQS